MGKCGFKLVIEKPKARLTFAAATRVRPSKKVAKRHSRTRKYSPVHGL